MGNCRAKQKNIHAESASTISIARHQTSSEIPFLEKTRDSIPIYTSIKRKFDTSLWASMDDHEWMRDRIMVWNYRGYKYIIELTHSSSYRSKYAWTNDDDVYRDLWVGASYKLAVSPRISNKYTISHIAYVFDDTRMMINSLRAIFPDDVVRIILRKALGWKMK